MFRLDQAAAGYFIASDSTFYYFRLTMLVDKPLLFKISGLFESMLLVI